MWLCVGTQVYQKLEKEREKLKKENENFEKERDVLAGKLQKAYKALNELGSTNEELWYDVS